MTSLLRSLDKKQGCTIRCYPPHSAAQKTFLKNEVNPALPDFSKPVLDSHNLFCAHLASWPGLRISLESQSTEIPEAHSGQGSS